MPPTPFERRTMDFLDRQLLPPPYDHASKAIWKQMGGLAKKDATFQRKVKKHLNRLKRLVLLRMQGGAGLIMSKTIRYFFLEYVDRMLKYGSYSLPGSFNVVESFLIYNKEYLIFDLLPEIDHLLNIDDYFEWYDSNDLPKDPKLLLDVMEEGVIYSYNMTNDSSGYRFVRGGSTLIIAGISIIRHENEISCFLVAGEQPPNPPDQEITADGILNGKPSPGHEDIGPDPDLGIKNRYLDEFPGFARIIVVTRFDIRAMSHGVRYVMCDRGNNFITYTDEIRAVEDMMSKEELQEYKQKTLDVLAEYGEIFSALAALIYLPVSFIDESIHVYKTEFATELSSTKEDKDTRKAIKEHGKEECFFTRTIRSLASSIEQKPNDTKNVYPPELKFRSYGGWESISPGEVGMDRSQ